MPSHNRIKNISYDDDDDYYSEEEEELDDYDEPQATSSSSTSPAVALNPDNPSNSLTDSDRESLRNGCVEVRQLLGALDTAANAMVGDAEVWEALWEFYYDVDASVEWLREKVGKKMKEEAEKEKKRREKEKEKQKMQQGKGGQMQGKGKLIYVCFL